MGNGALCTYGKEISNEENNTFQVQNQFIEEQKKLNLIIKKLI